MNSHRRCMSSKLVTNPSVAVTTLILEGRFPLLAFEARGVSNFPPVFPLCVTDFSICGKPWSQQQPSQEKDKVL